jgi:hypothetical protein
MHRHPFQIGLLDCVNIFVKTRDEKQFRLFQPYLWWPVGNLFEGRALFLCDQVGALMSSGSTPITLVEKVCGKITVCLGIVKGNCSSY